MITQKIRRFTKKVFSSKSWVLALLNRFLPKEFGTLEDFTVDRDTKNIFLTFSKETQRAKLDVYRYGMRYEGEKSFVTFDSLIADGFLKPHLKTLAKTKEIAVDPKHIVFVKKLLRA